MALWIRDGFDKYANFNDLILNTGVGNQHYGVWDSFFNSPLSAQLSSHTPFARGQSINPNNTGFANGEMRKSAPAPATTIFMRCRFYIGTTASAGSSVNFKLYDGTTIQFVVTIQLNQNIILFRGASTTVSTFTSAFNQNVWNAVEIKVVIDSTNGEFHIRMNGATSDTFSATGLNTQNTGNNTASLVGVNPTGASGVVAYVDDVAIWDSTSTTSGYWQDWMGDITCLQNSPVSDNSVQMTQVNGGSTTFGVSAATSSSSRAANTILFLKTTPTAGGSLAPPTVTLASALTGHLQIALYDSDGDNINSIADPVTGNSPGTLLGYTNQLTNPGSGSNPTTWAVAPANIIKGHSYFWAVWVDASATINDNNINTAGMWSYSLTYASGGFPTAMNGLGSGTTTPVCTIFSAITITNSGMCSDQTQDGSTTLVQTNTPGKKDLYGLEQNLPPNAIVGVDISGMVSKSDVGSRTISHIIKSGSTEVDYTAITPLTTFAFSCYQQDTDPNTGLPWTTTGLQNALIGQKIVT